MNKTPYFSIIIVNWNGIKWLQNCLNSVFNQDFKSFEVIFVDNGSEDGSCEFVEKKFPKVKIINLSKNHGFAVANNIGMESAKGEILFLLNNDTVIKKDLLDKILPIFKDPKIGIVQPKLVLLEDKNKLDLVGAYWTSTTFLSYFGLLGDSKARKYNQKQSVFSNKGAAMFIRKSMIDKIGGFDADFWSYYEETDLCQRAWISGYQCWYFPVSVCFHANGGTSLKIDNSFIQFHNFKNKFSSFLKNFELKNLIKIVPTFVFLVLGLSFWYLITGKFQKSLALLKSLFWNLKNLKKTISKRKIIQLNRKISDHEYLPQLTRKMTLSQIFKMVAS